MGLIDTILISPSFKVTRGLQGRVRPSFLRSEFEAYF